MDQPSLTPELLDGFPVVVSLPVQWNEMDAYGHVNNTVYFRYFEAARIEYLERIGIREVTPEQPTGVILHSTSARFRLPVRYPDQVRVGARTVELLDDRFRMEYRVVSEAAGATAAEGWGVVVCFDYAGQRKAALPEAVRHAIQALDDCPAPG
jgi:acyl-CoA thioester hydrolase